jgi:hypothetical protein
MLCCAVFVLLSGNRIYIGMLYVKILQHISAFRPLSDIVHVHLIYLLFLPTLAETCCKIIM